jgi:soluble lytic murein transglycosylase-like protein
MSTERILTALLLAVCCCIWLPRVAVAGTAGAAAAPAEIAIVELASLRRLISADRAGHSEPAARAGLWTDLSTLADAVVVGAAPSAAPSLGRAQTSLTHRVVMTPDLVRRDRAAYQLLSLGYSPREAADVVSGRISKRALDMAQRMLMAGLGRDAASDYLDSQYRRLEAAGGPLAALPTVAASDARGRFDATIERSAGQHGVDAALVRAVIGAESAFNPSARSRKGALGLMQLMPATARELAVDPTVPEQNIDGGVRYLSSLLRTFGRVDLALVAYNAGPGFAARYVRGQAALYGETREYVRRVLARLQAGR